MTSFSAQKACQPSTVPRRLLPIQMFNPINVPIPSHSLAGLSTGPNPIEIDARNVTARNDVSSQRGSNR